VDVTDEPEEELARIYKIPILPQRDFPISWNNAPRQDVPAIRFSPKTGNARSIPCAGG
jgi:hypothetical protein